MTKSAKRILPNLLLFTATSVVAFLLLEIIVRITPSLGVAYPKVKKGNVFINQPNSSYWDTLENKNYVEYNNLGFHDYDREKEKDRYRFVFIGDSFTEAHQVPIADSFTSKLNQKLEEDGHLAEVVNAGVEGSNTAFEYLLWHDYIKHQLEVDHVVLMFTMRNDLDMNYLPLAKLLGRATERWQHYIDVDGNPIIANFEFSPLQKVIRFMGQYSAAVNLIYYRAYELKYYVSRAKLKSRIRDNRKKPNYKEAHREKLSAAWEESIEATIKLIDRWQKELKAEGIKFSVLFQRTRKGESLKLIHPKQPFIKRMKQKLKEQGNTYLVLRVNKYEKEDLFFYGKYDVYGHFNQKGHNVMAEMIYPWLKKKLPESSS